MPGVGVDLAREFARDRERHVLLARAAGAARAGILAAVAGVDRDDQLAHAGRASVAASTWSRRAAAWSQAIGAGNAGGDAWCERSVAMAWAAIVDAASPQRRDVETGLRRHARCAFGSVATRREVGFGRTRGGCRGVGPALVREGGAIGSTTRGAGRRRTAFAPVATPGHRPAIRAPGACRPSLVSMRGFSATTGAARSNTTRTVPGTGWPVRTDLTTPAPAGQRGSGEPARPAGRPPGGRGRRGSGSCIRRGRRAGVRRGCRWRPRSRVRSLISLARAMFQHSAKISAAPSAHCCTVAPLIRMAGS